MKNSQRSSSYPSYTIAYCLGVCEIIYKNYGTGYRATREELSEVLNLSVGNLTQKVSAAVQYGLLNLKSKEGYKVSELFVSIYRPIDAEQKKVGLENAFKSPTLYSNILETFSDGIIPPLKPLSNILLQKHSISDSACEKAASIFLENGKECGFIDDDNNISFSSKEQNKDSQEFSEDFEVDTEGFESSDGDVKIIVPNQKKFKEQTSSNQKDATQRETYNDSQDDTIVINVLLNNRRTAQVLLPKDITSKDCDVIKDWLDMIRKSISN